MEPKLSNASRQLSAERLKGGTIGMEIGLKTIQKTVLAPNLMQSVQILQMDSAELKEYLNSRILENPVIEIEPDEHKPQPGNFTYGSQYSNYADFGKKMNAVDFIGAEQDENLVDHLIHQLRMARIDKELFPVAYYVIGCLDENGYLLEDTSEIIKQTGFSAEKIGEAIAVVQGFEPPGVGARNLIECLCLQLRSESEAVEREVVLYHLNDVAKNRLRFIAERLGKSEARVEKAIQKIKGLHPKPGSIYGAHHQTCFIAPDISVEEVGGCLKVELFEDDLPKIRLNPYYIDMYKKSSDPALLKYIGDEIKKAEWLSKCVENRKKTLLKVAEATVEAQKDFFVYGPGRLGILNMQEIADVLEIHISTVSRAVNDKYLQCSYGTFPMKYFFAKGIGNGLGKCMSSVEIKVKIKELIDGEDKEKPLSDQQMEAILSRKGIGLSRRTIAKYRTQMSIPCSTLRVSSPDYRVKTG